MIPSLLTPPEIAGTLKVGSTLTASDGTWANIPTSFDRQWYRSGYRIPGETGSTYTLLEYDRYRLITFSAVASNADGPGLKATSWPAGPVHPQSELSRPAWTVPPSAAGSPTAGATITCSPGTVIGNPVPTLAYTWVRGMTPVQGGNADTLVVTAGPAVTCRVTATNDVDEAVWVTNAVGPISESAGALPVNTVLPSITGTVRVGSILTSTTGTWTNSPTGYARQWRRDGVAIAGATGTTRTLAGADEGKNISITVTATNADGDGVATSNAVGPVAAALSAPVWTATPTIVGQATEGSILSLTGGTVGGNPTPTLTYQWNRGGVAISGATSDTWTATAGAAVTCTVTATNSQGSAPTTTGAIGPIVSVPVNTVAPVVSGTAQVGATLSVSTGTWSQSPTGYAYKWFRAASEIAGATSSTYPVVIADSGTLVSSSVTATNAAGSASAASASVGPVMDAAAAPVWTVQPAITGSAVAGATLTCSSGTVSGNPTPAMSYQWRRGGSNISGATSATWVATSGASVDCVVTATNSQGNAQATTAAFGPIVAAPTNTVAPSISGTAMVGSMLTASNGTWTGSPSSYAFVWMRGGTAISGATASTYTLVIADEGANISVSVAATNGAGTSAPVASASVGPVAAALTVPVWVSTPTIVGAPVTGTVLSLSGGSTTGNPTPTLTYQWRRSNADISGATSATWTATTGTAVLCRITATNSQGSAQTDTAATAAIVAMPTNTVVPAITGTTRVGSTLTVSNGTWTGSPTYARQWKRNGTNISGATATTYALVTADLGTSITATVTGTNAAGSVSATSASVGPITAALAAPVWTAAPSISGAAIAGSTLTCSGGTVTGNPAPTFAYQWKRGGTSISGATAATWVATVGAAVTCDVTATNSQGSSTSSAAAFGPIAGAGVEPTITTVTRSADVLTVAGSSFGTASAPLLYDDFEGRSGTIPSSPKVGTWDIAPGPAPLAATTFTTAQSRYGTQSLASPRTSGEWGNFAVVLPDAKRFYLSAWFRYSVPAGIGQMRLLEVWGDYRIGDYNPGLMVGSDGGQWSVRLALENSGTVLQENIATPSQDAWHHIEAILEQSDVGVANGLATIKIDGATIYDKQGIVTRERAGQRWERAHFATAATGFVDESAKVWIDEAYCSDSWARAELGDAATYAACTSLVLQPATSWSDGSITTPLNPGGLTGTAYVYATNQSGAVNTSGYGLDVPAAYRGMYSTTFASRTNTVINLPAGVTDGDVLLMVHFVIPDTSVATPAGWTLLPGFPLMAMDQAGAQGFTRVWWRVASSEPASYTVTHAAISSQGIIYAAYNAATSAPVVSVATGVGTATTATGLTVGSGALVTFIAHNWETYGSGSPPGGTTPTFTERLDLSTSLFYIADGVVSSSGSTGDKTQSPNGNLTGGGWSGFLVAFAPIP